MMWYIHSFVAPRIDTQKLFQKPITDLLAYLERTLSPLSTEILQQNQELTQIKGLLLKMMQEKNGSFYATKARNDGQ